MSETTSPQTSTDDKQIANASIIVMAGFVLANLVGFVRQRLIGDAFGTGMELDAFYTAEAIPNMIFMLVAAGALASAFIPTYTALIETNQAEKGWRLASAIVNWVVIILVSVSVLSFIFAESIVSNVIAQTFVGEQLILTVQLFRIMLLTTIIFGVSGLIMGILNAHQSFVLPAIAPTFHWTGMIFGVVFLQPKIGIYGLAWGAVLGSTLHLLVQLPGLIKLPKFKYHLNLGSGIKEVGQVGKLMLPRLLGVGVVQINGLVNKIVANSLNMVGSVAAIQFGFQVMTMPQVVIAQSISIAAMPTFSAQIARGREDEMQKSLANVLRGILFLSIPAMIGLIILRSEVIALLFKSGEFGDDSVKITAWALLWYTAGLVGHSLVEILSRAFYAMQDTKTPVSVGIGAMSLNIGLSFWLPSVFLRWGWIPLGGIPLANSIATSLEMVILLVLIRNRLGGLHGSYIIKGLIPSIFSTILMAGGLVIWISIFSGYSNWVIVLGGILFGGAIYFISMWVLKVPEVKNSVDFIVRRTSRLVNRNGK